MNDKYLYLTKYPPHSKYSINRSYDSVVYSHNISERGCCRPGIKDQCGFNIEKERVVEDEAGRRMAEEAAAALNGPLWESMRTSKGFLFCWD